MAVFSSTTELIDYAQKFLDERLNSLEKDVCGCIANTFPFPGLLYCFSTVDLLGSLYVGDATGNVRKFGYAAGTTFKSKEYMIKMMGYPRLETELLQDVFRHKIVHLAQPNASPKFDKVNNRTIAWILENTYSGKHMVVLKLPSPQPVVTLTPRSMICDHVFIVSLAKFLSDIKESVYRVINGLLDKIKVDRSFQCKFESAIDHIYDPNL